jgi:hypothetical protein
MMWHLAIVIIVAALINWPLTIWLDQIKHGGK